MPQGMVEVTHVENLDHIFGNFLSSLVVVRIEVALVHLSG